MPYFSRLVQFARVSQRFDKTNLIMNSIKRMFGYSETNMCVYFF